jgi:hypothetical protein
MSTAGMRKHKEHVQAAEVYPHAEGRTSLRHGPSLRTGGKFVVDRFSGPSDVMIAEGVLITAGCDDVWTMLDGLKPITTNGWKVCSGPL